MRVRNKDHGHLGYSSRFNTYGIGEIIVTFEDGDASSEEIRDYDVLLGDEWVDLSGALKSRLLITDNYFTTFFPPSNDKDRDRGYTL